MTITIRDFDPTKDIQGKVKGRIIVDGRSFDAWFQKAEDIPVVQAKLDAKWAKAAVQTTVDEMNAAIAAKDAEIAAKNREIEEIRAKIKAQMDSIPARALERCRTVDAAQRLIPGFDTEGLNNLGIMKAVLAHRFADSAVVERSDDYIRARFDNLVDTSAPHDRDPFAVVVGSSVVIQANTLDGLKSASEKAYDEYVRSLTDFHRSR